MENRGDDAAIDQFARRYFALHVILVQLQDGRRVWRDLDGKGADGTGTGDGDRYLENNPGEIAAIITQRFGAVAVWYNRDGSRVVCLQREIGNGAPPGVPYDQWWQRQPEIFDGVDYRTALPAEETDETQKKGVG